MDRVTVVVLLLSACGDGDEGDPPGSDPEADAASPSNPDAAVEPDAAIPSTPDAGSDPDAAPASIVVDSVVFDGEFGQLRQGGEGDLVITGRGLAGVTAIAFDDGGAVDPTALVATDTEVRVGAVSVIHGAAPGPRDLTLIAGDETLVVPDAFEITPFVIEVDAAVDGRGTYQSPMRYCDDRLEQASGGDLLLFSAGLHVCSYSPSVGEGAELRGAGIGQTIVSGGIAFLRAVVPGQSQIHDMTMTGADPATQVRLNALGIVELRDLRLEGIGIAADYEDGGITLSRVTVDGQGVADCVAASNRKTIVISDSDLFGCQTGILLPAGHLEVTDTVVSNSELGIQFGIMPPASPNQNLDSAALTRVDLIDNVTGYSQGAGSANLIDVEIRGSSVAPGRAETGLVMGNGFAEASGLLVSGMSRHGVDLHTLDGSDVDQHATLGIDDSTIEGGEVGVDVVGSSDGAALALTGSIVRDQTVAAVRIEGYENSYFRVEDDQLSVISGHALDDVRTEVWFAGAVVEASGTTLNGNSYGGQLIQGPADIGSDLRIASDEAWAQF